MVSVEILIIKERINFMKELINANDKYKMNWIEGNTEWGTVKCPKGISVKKTSSQSGDIITERYTFTNTTDKDIFTSLKIFRYTHLLIDD